MRIYLAGPMTGRPDFNRPKFNAAQARLEALGYTVLSPARLPEPTPDPQWADWMQAAFGLLLRAEGVALLPNWIQSKGARVEVAAAGELGLPVRNWNGWRGVADVRLPV